MTNSVRKCKVWIRETGDNSNRRLLTEFDSASRFYGSPWWNRISVRNDGTMVQMAHEQRDGWKMNGPWPYATFEIEYFDFNNCLLDNQTIESFN